MNASVYQLPSRRAIKVQRDISACAATVLLKSAIHFVTIETLQLVPLSMPLVPDSIDNGLNALGAILIFDFVMGFTLKALIWHVGRRAPMFAVSATRWLSCERIA